MKKRNRVGGLALAMLLAGCGGDGGGGPGDVVRLTRFPNTQLDALRTVVDADGAITVLAVNRGPIDLGGGPIGAVGVLNLLLARYDAEHRHLWSVTPDLPAHRQRFGLGTVDGDPVLSSESGGLESGTLARLEGNTGDVLWVKALDDVDPDGPPIHPQDLAVAGDRIYLTGYTRWPDETLRQGVVVAVDSEGDRVWVTNPWPASLQQGSRVAVAADGTVVVTANNDFALQRRDDAVVFLDPGNGATLRSIPCPHDCVRDIEVAVGPSGEVVTAQEVAVTANPNENANPVHAIDHFDAAGTHDWSWVLGTGLAGDAVFNVDVAVDSAGNVAASGGFHGSVLIGARVFVTRTDALFVMSLDPSGGTRWQRYTGRTDPVTPSDVAIGMDDHVLATGFIELDTSALSNDAMFLLELVP